MQNKLAFSNVVTYRHISRRPPPLTLAVALLIGMPATAATVPLDGSDEFIRQQQREQAYRQQLESQPDVRLDGRQIPEVTQLPADESPCFVIDRLSLVGDAAEQFQVPNMKTDVTVPSGQTVRASAANDVQIMQGNAGNGGGGGVQFEVLDAPKDPVEFSSWFTNPRSLP